MLYIAWVVLGAGTVAAALMSRTRARARFAGRYLLATLFVVAGACVNLTYLVRGDSYADFAKGSYIPFVRDTWASVVVPHTAIFISMLVAFEFAAGFAVLLGGKWTQGALLLIMGFHVGLLAFGFFFFGWSLPMLAALTLLFRAERRAERRAQRGAEASEAAYEERAA